jgi:hypothetical protein
VHDCRLALPVGVQQVVYPQHHHLPFGAVAALLSAVGVVAVVLLPLIVLLFPDGRLPSRGFQRVARFAAVLTVYAADRRQQIKWLVSGVCVFIVIGLPALAVSAAIWEAMIAVGFAALPLAIGVGILRYRLYDIDRIISRTVAYGIVTALLAGGYIGLVLLVTRVLPFSSAVGVAVSTLAAAAAFNPLRRRVQHVVDRRFNRARYDADLTAAAFAGRLQDAVDLLAVQADLVSTVQGALEPAHVTVWINDRW